MNLFKKAATILQKTKQGIFHNGFKAWEDK